MYRLLHSRKISSANLTHINHDVTSRGRQTPIICSGIYIGSICLSEHRLQLLFLLVVRKSAVYVV